MNEGFPKENTPSNSHLFSWEEKLFDTYKLIEYGKDIKPVKIEVSELQKELGQNCWSDSNQRKFKPKDILDSYLETGSFDLVLETHPEWEDHIRRLKEADYVHYPVLIYQYHLIDGMHRLLKSFIDGATDIPVRIIDKLPDDTEYRGSNK